jgi:hypothetical protein
MPLKISQTQLNNEILIKLEGAIDEDTFFPTNFNSAIRLDMEKLTGMNSVGIRKFVMWTDKLKNFPMILEKCQPICVRNFNFVLHFYRPNMTIESFYVPYYSDATGERKKVLFRRGIEYSPGRELKLPVVKDTKGLIMELDEDEKSYFNFLKI